MTHFKRALLAATFGLVAVAGTARADIVTSLSAAPTAIAGGYAYTYNVQLAGGQLDAVTNGAPVQFGTIYDFGPTFGAITTTGLLSNFTWQLSNISSPTASQTAPNDDPNIMNIRFTYNSPQDVYVAGQPTTNPGGNAIQAGPANLGTFTVNSVFGPNLFAMRSYDGQSYKGTNDTIQGNVGFLSAPLLATDVPEPASLALLGAGLLGLGMVRRVRART